MKKIKYFYFLISVLLLQILYVNLTLAAPSAGKVTLLGLHNIDFGEIKADERHVLQKQQLQLRIKQKKRNDCTLVPAYQVSIRSNDIDSKGNLQVKSRSGKYLSSIPVSIRWNNLKLTPNLVIGRCISKPMHLEEKKCKKNKCQCIWSKNLRLSAKLGAPSKKLFTSGSYHLRLRLKIKALEHC